MVSISDGIVDELVNHPVAPHGEMTAAPVVPPCQQLPARKAVLRATIGGIRVTQWAGSGEIRGSGAEAAS